MSWTERPNNTPYLLYVHRTNRGTDCVNSLRSFMVTVTTTNHTPRKVRTCKDPLIRVLRSLYFL